LKPIISFLKGLKDSDNAIRIELAAILVNFSHRPYQQNLPNGLMDERGEPRLALAPQNVRMTEVGFSNKEAQQICFSRKFKTYLFGQIRNYFEHSDGLIFYRVYCKRIFFPEKECMKWEDNHCVVINCFKDKDQFVLIDTIDKEAMKLRKLGCNAAMKFFNKEKGL
jgi:hypothetical protein